MIYWAKFEGKLFFDPECARPLLQTLPLKTFRYGTINPERPKLALMAPTGVAAININGTTIHTALSIPKESGDLAPKMSDQKKTQLRLTLSELKLIIVDEISMVAKYNLAADTSAPEGNL